MTLLEYHKLKRENPNLTDEEFAVKAWNYQRQKLRDFVDERERERLMKVAEQKVEQEIDKNLEKTVAKALEKGFSNMNINIKI